MTSFKLSRQRLARDDRRIRAFLPESALVIPCDSSQLACTTYNRLPIGAPMRLFKFGVLLVAACTLYAQTPAAGPPPPELNHFNTDAVDRSLNACEDFYKYACS